MLSNSAQNELRYGVDLYSSSNRGRVSSWLHPKNSSFLRCTVSAVFVGHCFRRCLVNNVGCSDDCSAGNGAVCSAGGAAGGATASGSVDDFASALVLSFLSEICLGFLTAWMVETLRRRDTFLPLFELLVSFLQMSALGAVAAAIEVVFRVIGQLSQGRLDLHAVYFSLT